MLSMRTLSGLTWRTRTVAVDHPRCIGSLNLRAWLSMVPRLPVLARLSRRSLLAVRAGLARLSLRPAPLMAAPIRLAAVWSRLTR